MLRSSQKFKKAELPAVVNRAALKRAQQPAVEIWQK